MGRRISRAYAGRLVHVIALMDNAVVFASDLLRRMTCATVCSFVRVEMRDVPVEGCEGREIFFTPVPELHGRDVLVVDTVLQSGVTHDFLIKRLLESRPRSLRLAVLVDKPAGRRVDVHPDYFGFRSASNYLVGYGLSDRRGLYRNLAFVGVVAERRRAAAPQRRRQGRNQRGNR